MCSLPWLVVMRSTKVQVLGTPDGVSTQKHTHHTPHTTYRKEKKKRSYSLAHCLMRCQLNAAQPQALVRKRAERLECWQAQAPRIAVISIP